MHAPFTPWWNRIWVVQEAALAPRIEVIQGFTRTPWEDIADAAMAYKEHSTACCSQYLSSIPSDRVKVVKDFANRVLAIHESRGKMLMFSLQDLLRTFRDREASDPRDKVYALLGLAKSSAVPDYSSTDVEVFRRATAVCILSSRDLSILNNDRSTKRMNELPSWVPDWSSPASPIGNIRAIIATTCYNTWPAVSRLRHRTMGKTLTVYGTSIVKVVEDLGSMWGEADEIVQETLSLWWDGLTKDMHAFCLLICGDVIDSGFPRPPRRTIAQDDLGFVTWALQSKQSPFLDVEWSEDLFWSDITQLLGAVLMLWTQPTLSSFALRTDDPAQGYPPDRPVPWPLRRRMVRHILTLSGASIQCGELIDSQHNYQHSGPWRRLLSLIMRIVGSEVFLTRNEIISGIERSIVVATLFRRLLVFASGVPNEKRLWAGLGPREARIGDELYLLIGAKTPFILREGLRDSFTLVGDCYVEGMMDDCQSLFPLAHDQKRIAIC